MEAYFDNSATTKVFDCVRDAVVSAMCVDYGNPAARHRKGVEAENIIKEARKEVAKSLKVQEKEILFTSGGTESNNTALIGTALANKRAGMHIITTAIEHPSIYNTMAFLQEMGFEIEASYHANAPAQHEIDFKYDDGVSTADNLMTFRMAVRTIARRHGLHATFMPKPKSGVNGSGMHLNMMLCKDGRNIFSDRNDALGLSREDYYFIGGLLKHIKGMAAITNPIVNSYKRLVPGYEAPVYIAWSKMNRSPLIRIPNVLDGEGAKIELRSPDSASNPYLTLAVCLMAGLDGIQNKIEPPKSVDDNIFAMSEEERAERNIDHLPSSLWFALGELEQDAFICDVLGAHIAKKYIAAKKEEYARYRGQVSQWEIEEYLNKY